MDINNRSLCRGIRLLYHPSTPRSLVSRAERILQELALHERRANGSMTNAKKLPRLRLYLFIICKHAELVTLENYQQELLAEQVDFVTTLDLLHREFPISGRGMWVLEALDNERYQALRRRWAEFMVYNHYHLLDYDLWDLRKMQGQFSVDDPLWSTLARVLEDTGPIPIVAAKTLME